MQNRLLPFSIFIMAAGTMAFGQTADSPFVVSDSEISEEQWLGKQLFEDTRLSEPQGMSCASCHEPHKAFQGNNGSSITALAKGSRDNHFGSRNVPTLAYSAFTPPFSFVNEKNEAGEDEWVAVGGQFWDGRAADLAAQVEGPLLNAKEMNNASRAMIVEKVKSAPYAGMMTKIYGPKAFDDTDKAFENIAEAIALYENSAAFVPFSSKFDRVLAGKDSFTALEAKGFDLFKDPQKGNCLACHVGEVSSVKPQDWLFTDYTYDNLGIPRNGAIPENAQANYYDLGLCKQTGIEKIAPKDVDIAGLCGAFKVPTLRNIALTAPYGHNGFFNDLRDMVKFYVTRDTNPELWYPKNTDGSINKYDDLPKEYHENVNVSEAPYDRKPGEMPRLNEDEIDAVVAFLKTLTDEMAE